MNKEQCVQLKSGDIIEYDHKQWWEKLKVLENDTTSETVKLETIDTDYLSVANIGYIEVVAYDKLTSEHPRNGHYFTLFR